LNELTAALAAAAEGGDPKAHFSLVLMSVANGVGSPAERRKWVDNAMTQDEPTNIEWYSIRLWYGLQGVSMIIGLSDEHSPEEKTQSIEYLNTAAECGSATAQHIFGMFKLWSGLRLICTPEVKTLQLLGAGRWIRKAAKQGVKEAQYELGRMFGCANFGGIMQMRLARKYTRQASAQGHDEATHYMQQLRMCKNCGADNARRTCSRCRQVRYCNSTCSRIHWYFGYEGAGLSLEGKSEPHMHTCRHTHVRGRQPL
jgi:TPR repeat protein